MRVSQLVPHTGAIIKCKFNGQTIKALIYSEGETVYLLQDLDNSAQPRKNTLFDINRAFGTNFAFSYFLGAGEDNVPAIFEYISMENGVPIKKKEDIKEGDRYVSTSGEVFIVANYHEKSGIVYFKDTLGNISKMLNYFDVANSLVKEKEFKLVDNGDYSKFYNEDVFTKMIYKKQRRFNKNNGLNNRPNALKILNGGKLIIINEIGNQEIVTEAEYHARCKQFDEAAKKVKGVKMGVRIPEPQLVDVMLDNGKIIAKEIDRNPWKVEDAPEKVEKPGIEGENFEILFPKEAQIEKEWFDVKQKAMAKIKELDQKAKDRKQGLRAQIEELKPKKNGFF